MPQKQDSKRKTVRPARERNRGRTKAVTVLGVAGALSLAGGASAAIVGPALYMDWTYPDLLGNAVVLTNFVWLMG